MPKLSSSTRPVCTFEFDTPCLNGSLAIVAIGLAMDVFESESTPTIEKILSPSIIPPHRKMVKLKIKDDRLHQPVVPRLQHISAMPLGATKHADLVDAEKAMAAHRYNQILEQVSQP